MMSFVDPRTGPKPPARTATAPPSNDPQDVYDLIEHCRHGRIYAVEEWIRAGRPLQARHYKTRERTIWPSPIQVAVDQANHDLALLLLCNGYDLRLEGHSVLASAITKRRPDHVALLLAWGDDPSRVWPEDIFHSYDSVLIAHCWDAGVDYCKNGVLAHYLGTHANKPLLGWAKHHASDERIRRQLGMALRMALWEERERSIHLLLWAGADPLLPVGDVQWSQTGVDDDEPTPPVMDMIRSGSGRFLKLVDINDLRFDVDALAEHVCDPNAVRVLAPMRPQRDWSAAIVLALHRSLMDIRAWAEANRGCLEELGRHGARLTHMETKEIGRLRREMLRTRDNDAVRFVARWMTDEAHCDPLIYEELVRTSAMLDRLKGIGVKRPKRHGR